MKKKTKRPTAAAPSKRSKKISRVSLPERKVRARGIIERLREEFPEATCALNHDGPFQLLVATVLSAQCTDARVNLVTPALFAAAPTPAALAQLGLARIKDLIKSINFFNNKAKSLQGLARALVRKHGGEVPRELESLVDLPGVGRKTANVVLGTAFGLAVGVVVDTHVRRLSQRLGLALQTDPVKIEIELMETIEQTDWIDVSHLLILHGRKTCKALKPLCGECRIASLCPSRLPA
jgi:endonuclease-3